MAGIEKKYSEILVVRLIELRRMLEESSNPDFRFFLEGLRPVIEEVLSKGGGQTVPHVPYLNEVMHGCMPGVEEVYMDFYSLARYGIPIVKGK